MYLSLLWVENISGLYIPDRALTCAIDGAQPIYRIIGHIYARRPVHLNVPRQCLFILSRAFLGHYCAFHTPGPNPRAIPSASSTTFIIARTFSSSHFLPTICTPTGTPAIPTGSYTALGPVYISFSRITDVPPAPGTKSAGSVSCVGSTRVTGMIPTGESMTLYRIVHAASGESVAQALDDGERVGWNHQCVKNDAYPWGMVGSDWTGAMIASKPYLLQTYFWGGIVGWTSEISPILTSLYHAWITLLR